MFHKSAIELSREIKKNKITVLEVVTNYIHEIEAKDSFLNSYVIIDKQNAYRRSEEVQWLLAKGLLRGPLVGVPMSVKDNILVKNVKATGGSKLLENFVPIETATAIKNLEDAGAILLGKNNLDEFGIRNTSHMVGDCAEGSSRAVANNLCGFSIGSDTGGSIRRSSAYCGVVGLKPTYGTVSRKGLMAYAPSFDQMGPITQNVTDCAVVLEAMASYDKEDSTSVERTSYDFIGGLKEDVEGLIIGIPREYLEDELCKEMSASLFKVAEVLKKKGAIIKECNLTYAKYHSPAYHVIASVEASSSLSRFDGIKYGYRSKEYNNMKELYEQTRSKGFAESTKETILLGTLLLNEDYYNTHYQKALRVRRKIKEEFDFVFKKIDVLLTPVTKRTESNIHTDIKGHTYDDMFLVGANLCGLPAITVPIGKDRNGLPIGVQFIGDLFKEKTIIQSAYSYEQSVRGES